MLKRNDLTIVLRYLKGLTSYLLPTLAILGAVFQNNLFTYALIIGICVVVCQVAFDKLNEKHYPHLVFAISLALLYQTTLISPGLIGTDVHTEYYFYYKALNGWDISIPHSYNSAIGTTVIAPFLTNYLHISGYWIYKAVFPFLFAFVPLLLYHIFRKQFGTKIAFLSAFFFVSIPTYMLEMIGLPRQMLAELMFAVCLSLIMVSGWKLRIRIPLLIVCSILGAMFHYVIGPAMWLYFGLGCILLLFYKNRSIPIKWLAVIIAVLFIASISYYTVIAQGVPLASLAGSSYAQLHRTFSFIPREPPTILPALPSGAPPIPLPPPEPPRTGFFAQQEPMIRAALGMDFTDVSVLGKTFRIFQYATQLCIIAGCIQLFRYRRKYSAEYLCFCVVSVLLLTCCILLPRFSNILNASRFYHLSLFLLAPTLVLGGLLILRNVKILTLCLVIPYFLFTSGFIFEATQQTSIQTLDVPYSISLSSQRVNVTGIFTENDIAVRDWAVENDLGFVYADINGCLLFSEKVEMDWPLNWRYLYNALENAEFKEGKYIFLSERNNQTETLTFKPMTGESATGMRQDYSYSWIDQRFRNKEITSRVVYQIGDAMIIEILR